LEERIIYRLLASFQQKIPTSIVDGNAYILHQSIKTNMIIFINITRNLNDENNNQ